MATGNDAPAEISSSASRGIVLAPDNDISPIAEPPAEYLRRCHDEFVKETRAKIIAIGQPKKLLQPNYQNGQKLKHTLKTKIRCRFYPRDDVRKILTEDVVRRILKHDCPQFCDVVRRTEENDPNFGSRYTKNKAGTLCEGWVKSIVHGETSGFNGREEGEPAIMLFALLVMIRRPLLITGFLAHKVSDRRFQTECKHLDGPGQDYIYTYWQNFHNRFTTDDEEYEEEDAAADDDEEEAEGTTGQAVVRAEDLDMEDDDEFGAAKEPKGNPSVHAAKKFRSLMWSFVTPDIPEEGNLFKWILHDKVILPITRSRKMGEGAFAKVFKVCIHPEYCRAIHQDYRAKNNWYAVKEMSMGNMHYSEAEVDKELDNLRSVQIKGPHPNIVRFLAAYVHASLETSDQIDGVSRACHLLMPLYDGDLSSYLQGKIGQCNSTLSDPSVVNNGLYKELIGVVGAVNHLVMTVNMHRLDLKPANILVRLGGSGQIVNLALTDFGRAKVESQDMTSTAQAVSFDGNVSANYAPPEASPSNNPSGENSVPKVTGELSKRYDVWPLGCIFNEVLTFLVMGSEGHKTFKEKLRGEHEPGHVLHQSTRYWQHDDEGKPIVRPSVSSWIHAELTNSNKFDIQDMRCATFIRWNAELMGQMLIPDAHNRLSISDVVGFIRRTLLDSPTGVLHDIIETEEELNKLLGKERIPVPANSSVPASALPPCTTEGQAPSISAEIKHPEEILGSSDDELFSHSDEKTLTEPPPSKVRTPIRPPPQDVESPGLVKRQGEEHLLTLERVGYLLNGNSGIGEALICSAPKSHGAGFDFVIRVLDNVKDSQPLEHRVLRRDTMVVPFPLHVVRPHVMQSLPINPQEAPHVIQFGGSDSNSSNYALQTSNPRDMKLLLYKMTQQYVAISLPIKSFFLRPVKKAFYSRGSSVSAVTHAGNLAQLWIEFPPITAEAALRRDSSATIASSNTAARSRRAGSVGTVASNQSTTTSSTFRESISTPPLAKRRVVLHTARGIYSIRMDGGLHFTTDDKQTLSITRLKAVAGTKSGRIGVGQIHSPDSLPAIPMCLRTLSSNEKNSKMLWSSIEIEFTTRDNMLAFAIEYGEEYLRFVQEGVMYGGEAKGFTGAGSMAYHHH